MNEHRRVDVDEIRRWYRDQAELSSVRVLAADAGGGRTTLHHFLAASSHPHPRVRRLLALHYLAHVQRDAPDLQAILCAIPNDDRAAATARLRSEIARIHEDYGVDPPAWARG